MTKLIHLTQYKLIELTGVDSEKFLQGQLTCDVTKLKTGDSTLTAHCDPKGKVSSVFRLIRVAQEQFYLLFRTDLLPAGLDQLKKYAVFSKVAFAEPEVQLAGVIGENCGQFSASFVVNSGNAAILINPAELLEFNASAEAWDCVEIQRGYPILSAKTQNEFIPQALNLQCIEQAVSFQKGCYIGQETVARAKYRGANKRAMFIFKARSQIIPEIGGEIEMRLENGWRKTGVILSAVNFGEVLWLQVVLNNRLEDGQQFRLPTDETALELYPLPYELV
ncbi:CAF17-like 4Fe-4S cluster assembly/insertion protein YgfZ [Basfia succiniciproducens]|uniref:CAF17-like 4Fe-4S cluster assembly/insertion protein YgfZ n=1 Tax=Basfia succiniciproducens TaxID=653940 RepID=UPI0008D34200|nr:hypothetical protein [Basfia succiniciproducens]SEQ10400.1 hypothetical protein SAMN02910415_00947 [Basfia succiniciproducens]